MWVLIYIPVSDTFDLIEQSKFLDMTDKAEVIATMTESQKEKFSIFLTRIKTT